MATRSKSIDSKTLIKLRAMSFHVSYQEISEATGLSVHTIGNAIRTGIATKATTEKLTSFLNEYKIPA